MYVLENGQVPNQITLDNVLDEVNAKDVRLSWDTPFTCSDFRVVVRYVCGRGGEDTFEMYLRYRYRYARGCIFCIFQILRYRYH